MRPVWGVIRTGRQKNPSIKQHAPFNGQHRKLLRNRTAHATKHSHQENAYLHAVLHPDPPLLSRSVTSRIHTHRSLPRPAHFT